MKRLMFVALVMILTLSAFRVPSVSAAPEPPVDTLRTLVALLSGPGIDGVVPTAKAEFGVFLQGQTALEVRASKLNLPDFTCLDVSFGRTVVQDIPVRGGSAFLSLNPSPVVRPGELITISIGEPPVGQTGCGGIVFGSLLAPATGTLLLSGTFQ